VTTRSKKFIGAVAAIAICAFAVAASVSVFAQAAPSAAAPKVTQIDILALKRLVRPKDKPLLINFWATWCVPCREEYPDLVKIDQEYRGKIDFVTISLDDLADKDTLVPQFLTEMKAEMPSYLLFTDGKDEAAMAVVSKDWTGALPFTILFNQKGIILYSRQGKVKIEALKSALIKSVPVTITPAQK
jgi:thiol-disulfide isomerase/thioredoxin